MTRPPPTAPSLYPKVRNAWIDPEGRLYEVGYEGHSEWAYDYLPETWDPCRQLGWVKISGGDIFARNNELTQSQMDTLWDWSQSFGGGFCPRHYTVR